MIKLTTKIRDIVAEILAAQGKASSVEGERFSTGITLVQEQWNETFTEKTPSEREVVAHFFNSTEEAYDASQCDDGIKEGDLLIIPSERVIGFLMAAWPVAVSADYGVFGVPTSPWSELEDGRYVEVAEVAEAIISQWPGVTACSVTPDPEIDEIIDLLAPVSQEEMLQRMRLLDDGARAMVAGDLDALADKIRAYADLIGITAEQATRDIEGRYQELVGDQDLSETVILTEQPVGSRVGWGLIVLTFLLGMIIGTGVGRIILGWIFSVIHFVVGGEMVLLYHLLH